MAHVEALRAQIEGLQLELKQAEAQVASNGATATGGEESSLIAPYSRSYGRTPIAAALRPSAPGGDEGNLALVGQELTVGGWVRTGREALAGALAFVGLNDGSCQGVLQVVLPAEVAAAFAAEQRAEASKKEEGAPSSCSSSASDAAAAASDAAAAASDADTAAATTASSSASAAAAATLKAACQMGACLLVSGVVVLSKPPDPEKLKRDLEAGKPAKEKKTQLVELKATKLLHLGPCDNGKGAYPLAGKGRHTLEHLRDVAHLRPRTATFGAVARIRSCLASAAHEFFQQRGFHYVTSPLITASDCEGAGEMFQVTTLLSKADEEFQREKSASVSAAAAPAPAAAEVEEAPPATAAAAAAAAAPKEEEEAKKPAFVPTLPPEAIAALEAAAAELGDKVRALKGAKAPKEEVEAAVALLKAAKEQVFEATGGKKAAKEQEAKSKKKAPAAAAAAAAAGASSSSEGAAAASVAAAPPVMVGGLPRSAADGKIDYSADFFGKPAFLTVSGQLNAEYYACALTSVYTFGPTFRAENSHTSRHLAEFWMIEPEIAFADLRDDMRCAEDFIVFCVRKALACCSAELDFLENHTGGAEKGKVFAPVSAAGTRKRLEAIAAPDSPGFARVSYTEAVEILKKHIDEKKVKFELPVEWGVDLASEHERYLTDVVHEGRPVIVFDYPKEIKAFYMRANDDGKTVAAMDILVPGVGELVGGSQREERLEVLVKKLEEMGEKTDASSPYSPYLDLRRYGRVPHAGFGVGFERLVQFVAGLDNIRDSIPFPRWPNNAAF